MSIKYRVDILAALKEKGYSQNRIRSEKLIGQSYLTQLRHGELVSWKTIETSCKLLECQPGDILKYSDNETPNAETLEAFAELDNGGGHSFSGTTEQLFSELMENEKK